MRLIDADTLKPSYVVTSTTTNSLCHLYVNIEDINSAPTVDAVPVRHGRWKTVEDWDGDEHYKCSVCGAEFVLIDGSPEDNDYLYCPHCGADMRKDGEQA